jgi:arginyl-tRNA synthetase
VVRARNIRAKLEAEGHSVNALLQRARGLDLRPFLTGEEGDEAWALFLLIARTDEVAEQGLRSQEVALVAKHAFAVAQGFHSYYQKPAYSVLHAASDDLRAARLLVVETFLGGMQALCRLLGIPIPERM